MKKSFKWFALYSIFLLTLTFFPENKRIQNYFKDFLEKEGRKTEIVTKDNGADNRVVEEDVLYRVLSITDGDTIRIDFKGVSTPVRLIGIDTPEVNHPVEPVQCYGVEASRRTKELLDGKDVVLEQDVSETDRYGRILAYVWLNGEFINEKLVKEGYAFSSSYPPDVKYQEILNEAETYARENSLGLWSQDTCKGDIYTRTTKPNTE